MPIIALHTAIIKVFFTVCPVFETFQEQGFDGVGEDFRTLSASKYICLMVCRKRLLRQGKSNQWTVASAVYDRCEKRAGIHGTQRMGSATALRQS
jgi:hypothetical protein